MRSGCSAFFGVTQARIYTRVWKLSHNFACAFSGRFVTAAAAARASLACNQLGDPYGMISGAAQTGCTASAQGTEGILINRLLGGRAGGRDFRRLCVLKSHTRDCDRHGRGPRGGSIGTINISISCQRNVRWARARIRWCRWE